MNQVIPDTSTISGHQLGSLFCSKINPYVYIPIPKNASTWATAYFSKHLNWEKGRDYSLYSDHHYDHLFSTIKYQRKIVILRDPIDRWITGISQYIFQHVPDLDLNNKQFYQYFFSKKVFDEHTDFQVNFIRYLELKTVDFFKVDNNLYFNLDTHLKKMLPNEHKPIPTNLEKNRSSTDKAIRHPMLQLHLKKMLTENKDYLNSLQNFYHSDYNLINNITFINYK